jgi:hypothetical protein
MDTQTQLMASPARVVDLGNQNCDIHTRKITHIEQRGGFPLTQIPFGWCFGA